MDKALAAELFGPAARQALAAFGIHPAGVEIELVSENVTFKVIADDGQAYALRLHRPGYNSQDELNSEVCWTTALVSSGLHVPPPVAAPDGRHYVAVQIPERRETRFAGVSRWVEARPLAQVLDADPGSTLLHLEGLGAMAAAVHAQADAWTPPSGFIRRRLDADGLMGPSPCWGRFWENPALAPAQRDVLERTRDRLHAKLLALGERPGEFGLIHADLHAGNVLVAPDRLLMIDFDDAGYGWRTYEAAVALFYLQDEPDFDDCRRAFFRGYQTVRPTEGASPDLLPMFLLIRGLALMGWILGRPELNRTDPELTARTLAQCQTLLDG